MSREAAAIYAAMQEEYELLSGCVPDPASDFSLRFHTLAAELAELEARGEALERQCFPLTATGQALDAHAAGRGLARRPAAYAVGEVTFTRQAGAQPQLPAGTVCTTADGERYETTQAAAFPEEALAATVPAQAQRAGRRGNAAAGAVCQLADPIPGVAGVANAAPFSGGAEEEGDGSLRDRLRRSIMEPANGANPAWYRQQAENWPGVQSAQVDSLAGQITLYLAGEGGSPLPQSLCQQVAEALATPRQLCLTVSAAPAPVKAVAVEAAVAPAPGRTLEELQEPLAAAVEGLLAGLAIGEPLAVSRLVQAVMATGLAADCRITQPAAAQAPAAHGVLRAGTVTITQLEEDAP